MAVAFDAFSTAEFVLTDPATFTHTPVGTPRGVVVFVLKRDATTDTIAGVTYGGVSMTAVAGGFATDTVTELMACKAFFLGASIPTGAQTVSIDHDGGSETKRAVCVSMTAAADTAISGTPVLLQEDGALTEQNVDSGADTALRFAMTGSGLTTAPTAGANSTIIASGAIGANRSYASVRETTAGAGSRPVGFSGASDDRAAVHLAVAESGGGGPNTKRSFAVVIA